MPHPQGVQQALGSHPSVNRQGWGRGVHLFFLVLFRVHIWTVGRARSQRKMI